MNGKRPNSNFQRGLDAVWNELQKRKIGTTITRHDVIGILLLSTSLKKDKSTIYSTADGLLSLFQKDNNIKRLRPGEYTIINNTDNGKCFNEASWRGAL